MAGFALMDNKKANSIVSVCQADHPPIWYNTLPADGAMTNFIRNETINTRRQDTDIFYRINGAVFLTNTDYLLNGRNIYRNLCFAYIMDKRRSIDIDDELDFLFAEAVLQHFQ
jgi:CMP-N,N'-diacetyllegionaminic acid synthase